MGYNDQATAAAGLSFKPVPIHAMCTASSQHLNSYTRVRRNGQPSQAEAEPLHSVASLQVQETDAAIMVVDRYTCPAGPAAPNQQSELVHYAGPESPVSITTRRIHS